MKNEFISHIDTLLSKNNNHQLIEIYFDIFLSMKKKYGENVIVLMEIGSFYEMYQIPEIGNAKVISDLLNISLTKKNKNIQNVNKKNPQLAGIPSVSIDKYLNIIQKEKKWNVLLINQYGKSPNIIRKVSKILSPGTDLNIISDNNFTLSLFIEKNKEGVFYGAYSKINVISGEIEINEIYGNEYDKDIIFDKLNSSLNVEINEVIVHNSDNIEKDFLFQEIPLLKNKNVIIKKLSKKSMDLGYINLVLSNIYDFDNISTPIENLNMERKIFSIYSFINLIEFLNEHDKSLIYKMHIPKIIEDKETFYMGNSPLTQLNIFENDGEDVFNVINNCKTVIGKRKLKKRIKNPIIDKEELINRHLLSELFYDIEVNKFSKYLSEIYDLERLKRKIEIKKIHPFEFFNFFQSLKNIEKINFFFLEKKEIEKKFLNTSAISLINYIEDFFYVDFLSMYTMTTINKDLIKENKNKDLIKYKDELNKIEIYIDNLLKKLNKVFLNTETKQETFKLFYSETEGFYFETTLKKYNFFNIENSFLITEGITLSDFKIKKLKNSVKLYIEDIKDLNKNYDFYINKIININKKEYLLFLETFNTKFSNEILHLIDYISEIDFAYNNFILKTKYGYNKPNFIEEKKLNIKKLRHPIVERYNKEVKYIDNDIYFDKEKNGFLLFGINSSGKSTLMKSVGISIILAQSGVFVPCDFMEFKIYDKIFTRITGNDNIKNGLSTFAIEMLELKNILQRSTNNSIVIGDEISHGTETTSALSIVSSAVKLLSENETNFIFATHLHQIDKIKEIKEIKNLNFLHMSILYKEEENVIIYDRKLKEGKGTSIYGLEYAKFLSLDKKFINLASKIRKQIINEEDNLDLIIKNKKSRYNSEKIIQNCEICGKNGTEVHHINEQKNIDNSNLDKKSFIQSKFNLVNLCKYHHNLVHKKKLIINGYVFSSKGIYLDYVFKDME